MKLSTSISLNPRSHYSRCCRLHARKTIPIFTRRIDYDRYQCNYSSNRGLSLSEKKFPKSFTIEELIDLVPEIVGEQGKNRYTVRYFNKNQPILLVESSAWRLGSWKWWEWHRVRSPVPDFKVPGYAPSSDFTVQLSFWPNFGSTL